ncbi:MAG: hypothetical protein ACM3S4_00005 [Burkholderiales bacterium]
MRKACLLLTGVIAIAAIFIGMQATPEKEVVAHKDFFGKLVYQKRLSGNGRPLFMCARHARDLDGESPLRGLIAPTVSQRQGCPS